MMIVSAGTVLGDSILCDILKHSATKYVCKFIFGPMMRHSLLVYL